MLNLWVRKDARVLSLFAKRRMLYYFHERDFLLASGNRGRQLWAEHFLEFPLCGDEAWRLASYDFFRERFEKRLLEEMDDRALDLRPGRDEDPGSPEYKARLRGALAEDDMTTVGAAVVYENTLFRISAITRSDVSGHSKTLCVWSLNRAPVLPDKVSESVSLLREAQAAALVGLVANHGLTVIGSGFTAPNSGLVDPVASNWVDWVPLNSGFDLEACRRTLQKGIKGLKAVSANPCAPIEQGHYFPPLDNAVYTPETVGWLRAKMDREDRSRDPENLSSFQKAAVTGGEGFCLTAMETQEMRSLVECPILAAVSIDCVPFGESLDPGAPAFMMLSFVKAGLEHSVSITAREIAEKRLPLAKMKVIPGLKRGRIIIAAGRARMPPNICPNLLARLNGQRTLCRNSISIRSWRMRDLIWTLSPPRTS